MPLMNFQSTVKILCLSFGLLLSIGTSSRAQLEFESPPIDYQNAPAENPVARLHADLVAGRVRLEYSEEHGYLPALLDALDISPESQVLVFSQTSFQLRKITPQKPRAIYFNDETYVGWVQHSDLLEISTADPNLGAVFYSLEYSPAKQPSLIRDQGHCLTCHASSRTKNVPGHLVRSVFVDRRGQPLLSAGTFNTEHSSPFSERWGGWYVTGTHGTMRHMGNAIVSEPDALEKIDREAGANLVSLDSLFETSAYLTPHSDVVALMVLEHQSTMHNHFTFAQMDSRLADHYDGIMNKALERPAEYQSESTVRRFQAATEKIVQYMLFCDEFKLESPVAGTSGFADYFSALGPKDSQGRSLRDFDLKTRLFKYPCSYLIYADSFQQLPQPVVDQVLSRLEEILTAETVEAEFAHLSDEDRKAIHEILSETLPQWKTSR